MGQQDIAIEFKNVSKIYKLKRKIKKVKKDEKTQFFYALKDLSFQVKKGQVLGILGTNGSLENLQLALVLSGIASPDEGEIIVNGEQALVAINTGLNKQLTGLAKYRTERCFAWFIKKKSAGNCRWSN